MGGRGLTIGWLAAVLVGASLTTGCALDVADGDQVDGEEDVAVSQEELNLGALLVDIDEEEQEDGEGTPGEEVLGPEPTPWYGRPVREDDSPADPLLLGATSSKPGSGAKSPKDDAR